MFTFHRHLLLRLPRTIGNNKEKSLLLILLLAAVFALLKVVAARQLQGLDWHDPVYRDQLEMTGQVHALRYLKSCRGGEFVANPQ